MSTLTTRRGEIERAVEIATVLFASGFDWLLDAIGLQACVSPRCRFVCSFRPKAQCPHHVDMTLPLPDRIREVLERLGPTFVKGGQMLALRPDYVPLEYAEALRSLHDAVPPFAGAEAERLVAAELGAPLTRLYADFEHEPFAAASLSQVHRATLPDGRVVAVKVQRPGIAEQVERDLALLAFLARRIERRRPEAIAFRPTTAVSELAEYTRRELDFRREARTAERVRELFAGDERVVVPAIDPERTSARVLTMELVEGLRPAPAPELRAAGLDPESILRAGADAMVRQIFVHGLFHADPHPGNLLLLPGNRICFLDFGMFGRLGRRERRALQAKIAVRPWRRGCPRSVRIAVLGARGRRLGRRHDWRGCLDVRCDLHGVCLLDLRLPARLQGRKRPRGEGDRGGEHLPPQEPLQRRVRLRRGRRGREAGARAHGLLRHRAQPRDGHGGRGAS